MKNLIFFFFLFLIPSSHAVLTICNICEDEPGISCGNDHFIGADCLLAQVKGTVITSTEQAEEILNHGLPCKCYKEKCSGTFKIDEVKTFLPNTVELTDLFKQIHSALEVDLSISEISEGKQEIQEIQEIVNTYDYQQDWSQIQEVEVLMKEVTALRNQIFNALSFYCPKCLSRKVITGLAPIEGCNAAICDVEKCEGRFCYLCFKEQPDVAANHKHSKTHSNAFWEERDAFTGKTSLETNKPYIEEEVERYFDYKKNTYITVTTPYTYTQRYHWLVRRKKLGLIFDKSIFEKPRYKIILDEALRQVQPNLKKLKMWPFPHDENTDQWISRVNQDQTIDLKNRIVIFQNEFIYLYNFLNDPQISQLKYNSILTRMNLLKDIILSHNAYVLSSLDVGSKPFATPGGREPDLVPKKIKTNPFIKPIFLGDDNERINQLAIYLQSHYRNFYDLGGDNGQIYVIQDPSRKEASFILSDIATDKPLNHTLASQACSNLGKGTSLLTRGQFEALSRAVIKGNITYNPNVLPSMQGNIFWTSTFKPGKLNSVYTFNGTTGAISYDGKGSHNSTRCARPIPKL